MNALTVLLLCLAAACAVPVQFPVEQTVIYNYHADVKTGIIEPVSYASQFVLDGLLLVKKYVNDPTLNNAYYVKLQDLKYSIHNGMIRHDQWFEATHELGEDAQQIQDPFLIIYDESGKFQGVKTRENESTWSRNMKQGIASMMQLDLTHMQMMTPMKTHAFVTTENTIHGVCSVSYDVRSKVPTRPETTDVSNVFVVTKTYDQMNCSHFDQRVFDHVECERCHVESVDDMITTARRVFEVESHDKELLIKKMSALSSINYFPYNARSEAHYLLTNTTLDLSKVVPTTKTHLPVVNFQALSVNHDMTFVRPVGNYALHAAEDLTHGRHIVKLDALIPKLKKMLAEAADYLDEDHLDAKEPDWKHGQTINRLQYTMSYMDLGSLEQVYNAIQDAKTTKEVTMKNIFLRMIPTVGTTAACHFTRNVIRNHKVNEVTATAMLIKLPMHVKVPTERLLLEMEELLKLGSTVSPQVRKASILCFSTLIRKTYMNMQIDTLEKYPLLQRYLHRFFDHIKNDQAYDMKVTYLMAMKNIRVGNVEKFLEPIIRGVMSISDNPHHIRTMAIWAIKKAVVDKVEYTHDLLWPILADVTEPLTIRIMAYDVLMSQMPNMQRMMNIYWLMVYEKNNHLYNYHLTTLRSLANSVDPCLTPIRETARKLMRYTRIRPVTTELSSQKFTEYTDPMYEHGESWNTALILDELTGLPLSGHMEYRASVARKPVEKIGIFWTSYGMDEIMKVVKKELFGTTTEKLTNENVQKILSHAAQSMPPKKDIHVNFCVTLNGHVVVVYNFDQNTVKSMPQELLKMKQLLTGNFQEIVYDTLYEMQVVTDTGLQAVLSTRMPHLLSLRFNNARTEIKKPSVNLKLEIDARLWRHGEYVMSVYNPIVDVWHSARRATTQDVVLPVQMSVGYNHESKSMKVTMPRLPVTKLSHMGMRYHAKNLVTVTEDEQDALKMCCPTCQHHVVVTTGERRNYHDAVDSKDLGLKYSTSIFDCESNVTPMTNAQEWQRALSPEHKSTWNSIITRYLMAIRQKLTNDYISPEIGSCGILMKVEPSIVHPTSHVDLNVRVNVEDVNDVSEKLHALSGKKINVRGTLDAKAASTNESVRSWDVNVNVDMAREHMVNNVKVQITRTTPGEKNLKICVDAQKTYPETHMIRYPNISNSKAETNAKVTVNAGFTDDDKCVRDEMLVIMTVKGEMTEMQKNRMAHDSVHGACAKDVENLQFRTEDRVPKTMNCIHETVQYTTMRKYTINASYKKVPVLVFSQLAMIEDYIRATHLPHVRYITDRVESGNAKAVIELPFDLSHINATVVTPVSGYEYVEIPLQQRLFEGISIEKPSLSHAGWHVVMDNTHFSMDILNKVTQRMLKICTVYPQVLITLDNGMIPYEMSDQWTLVSGDHVGQTYAIFAKFVPSGMIAVRMYIAGHMMEIVPNKLGTVVMVDGNVVPQYEKGITVPGEKSYAMKLTMNNEHFVAQSQRVPVMMLWTPNSVSVMVSTAMQGQVTGMCGHMDDTHKEKMPRVFVAPDL